MPPLQMTDMTQTKEKLQKYHNVFARSVHYGMVNRDEIKFISNQYNEIDDEIMLALEIVDRYNFGDDAEHISTYAVAVLPFMIFDGKLIEPNKETKESYEQALQFLRYIKYNKGMANHHIATTTTDKYTEGNPPIIFDDFKGFDMEKVDKHIGYYEFLAQIKVGRAKRNWWGSSGALMSCMCFAYSVYLAWSVPVGKPEDRKRRAEQDRIVNFLYQFFHEMGYPIDDESIRTMILNKAKKNPFITANPYFVADKILL